MVSLTSKPCAHFCLSFATWTSGKQSRSKTGFKIWLAQNQRTQGQMTLWIIYIYKWRKIQRREVTWSKLWCSAIFRLIMTTYQAQATRAQIRPAAEKIVGHQRMLLRKQAAGVISSATYHQPPCKACLIISNLKYSHSMSFGVATRCLIISTEDLNKATSK